MNICSIKLAEKRFRHIRAFTIALFYVLVVIASSHGVAVSAENALEIALDHSINILPTGSGDLSMILKTWEETNDAKDRFVIVPYILAAKPASISGYYERVMVLDHGVSKELLNWESPDCSVSQTAFYNVSSTGKNRIFLITADRISSNGKEIISQATPRPQLIKFFEERHNNKNDPGKSLVWFEAIGQTQTDQALCDSGSVRQAMGDAVNKLK